MFDQFISKLDRDIFRRTTQDKSSGKIHKVYNQELFKSCKIRKHSFYGLSVGN